MNLHLHQWIANVFIGAIDANDFIDAIDYHWWLWETHRLEMAPMEPYELIHRSPMVIVIGANGDGVAECNIGTIRSISIGANGSPLAPFFVAIGANGANGENSKS